MWHMSIQQVRKSTHCSLSWKEVVSSLRSVVTVSLNVGDGELHSLTTIMIRPRGYKTFSCSTQLSMNFSPLINVKMPTIVWHFNMYEREK